MIKVQNIYGGEKLNIKEKRNIRNLTQEELAKKMNINRSTVAKWETGESLPRADKLFKLAKIFNCTVDELLK